MTAPPSFRLWSHLEERFCMTGETPPGRDANEAVFRSIVRANDARSAEAWVLQRKADPLLALRARVYRGNLREAAALAAELSAAAGAGEPVRDAEILLERARIATMEGDWREGERLCTTALALPAVAPVSQLTLYQIRALTLFETGQMARATEDLDRIDSLATIFPNSPSAFYAGILRARIAARDRGPAEGERSLERLWTRLLVDPNLDRIHALVRAELDLARLGRRALPAHLLAAWRITEVTGEHLYQAYAAVEAAYSGLPALEAHFRPIAREAACGFARIAALLAEVDGTDSAPASVTGATIAAAAATKVSAAPLRAEAARLLATLPAISALWFPRRRLLVSLAPFAAVRLDGQLLAALTALTGGPVPPNVFFARVWGARRYSAELHANPIAALLYRLRKRTGVSARLIGGEATLEGVLELT